MEPDKNKLIYEFARRVTIYEPEISVLDDKIYDQYILPVKAIDSCFKNKLQRKKLLLPELRNDGNETIAIYTDYGGESKNAAYNTYSFLVCGWNHSFAFYDFMKELRAEHKLGDKEISFKDLRFGPVNRALRDYLLLLNNSIPGILLTLAIDKNIKSVFGEKIPDYVREEIKKAGFGEWKPNVTEKVMRIVHSVAYLIALLSKDGHKLYWNTDHDSSVEGVRKHDNFINLFSNVLTLYTNNKFENIGYSVPFEEKSVRQLDFLSCPDLAAGAVEHYFTKQKTIKEITIKKEAELILSWLGRDGIALKKHTILIEKSDEGDIKISEVVFGSSEQRPEENLVQVPVKYKI